MESFRKIAQAWDNRHFRTPCDVLPSMFFSIPLLLPLLSPPFPEPQLPLPYQGPTSLFLLSSSPRLSNGLWLTVPFIFSKLVRKLLAFPTDIWVARKVFMQQSHQTLFCLHHAVQHMAAAAVVKLSVGKHLLHVGEKLLHRAVAPTGTLVLHRLEIHGVGDHIIVVLSLISGHRLPVEKPKRRYQHSLDTMDRNFAVKPLATEGPPRWDQLLVGTEKVCSPGTKSCLYPFGTPIPCHWDMSWKEGIRFVPRGSNEHCLRQLPGWSDPLCLRTQAVTWRASWNGTSQSCWGSLHTSAIPGFASGSSVWSEAPGANGRRYHYRSKRRKVDKTENIYICFKKERKKELNHFLKSRWTWD